MSSRCNNSYGKDYIDACRSRMEAQLATYRALAGASLLAVFFAGLEAKFAEEA